jgi:hypothetical protein
MRFQSWPGGVFSGWERQVQCYRSCLRRGRFGTVGGLAESGRHGGFFWAWGSIQAEQSLAAYMLKFRRKCNREERPPEETFVEVFPD